MPATWPRCPGDQALPGGRQGRAKDVTHFCMPATLARANSVAKAAGIDDKAICDPLHANCGDTGAAHT